MPARKPHPAAAKTQSERFIETARALGCPEDEAAFAEFKEKLGQIARHRPAETTSAPSDGARRRRGGA